VYSEVVSMSGSHYSQTLDLNHLDNGMYILSIESPDINVFRKLIIRK
ncbi:MAG: T9SS type A sorting domain-containing protein, partial [Bacteroidales bacterium]|nr:T9SS type A sorting domain-containing protein [Bacteroidales bacterium]